MIFIWLLTGCVIVALAFFLPGNGVDAWPALDMAGLAAALYLVALLVYTLRPPIPLKRRIITLALSLLVLAGVTVFWLGMKDTTNYQRTTLLKIHTVITRGIIEAGVPDFLDVLQRYHGQKGAKRVSLAEVFRQKYPNVAVGGNVHTPEGEWDSLRVFVTAISDSQINLVAYHPFSRGRNSEFVSYTGRKGVVQERFILTEKGLRHESDN